MLVLGVEFGYDGVGLEAIREVGERGNVRVGTVFGVMRFRGTAPVFDALCRGGTSKDVRALALEDAVSPGRYDRLKSDLKSLTPQEDAISAVAEREESCEGSLLSGSTDTNWTGASTKPLSPTEIDAVP